MKRRVRKKRCDGVKQRYWVGVSRPKTAKSVKGDGRVAEPKFDGTRMILDVHNTDFCLVNRRGVVKNEVFPELASIPRFVKGDAVFDGEVVVTDKSHPFGNFEKLAMRDRLKNKDLIRKRSKSLPARYVAFDILRKNGKDLRRKPLLERKRILDNTIRQSRVIQEIKYTNKPEELLRKVKKAKGEGIILKDVNSVYQSGETRSWEKIKVSKENDVAVLGYTKGVGKRKGSFGALKMGVNTKRGFKKVGLVGTGFKDKDLKDIKWRVDRGERLVARVRYRKLGSQGSYVEPRFVGLRTDISQRQTHK